MKIIFLDIDGVLVTRKSITERSGINAKFDPVAVRRLNRIVKHTDAKFVISSTWRILHSQEEMRIIFNSFGLDGSRIIDFTPITRDNTRGKEIAMWLSENNKNNNMIKNFIVMDDDSDIDPFDDVWVQTTWEDGISEHNVEHAIFLLEGK